MMPALGFCLNGIRWIFTFSHRYSTTVLSYIICVAHVHYQKPPCCLSCTRSLGSRSMRRVFYPLLSWWCRACGHRVVYCRPGFRLWYPCGPGLGLGFGAAFGLCRVSWVSLVSIRFSKCCMMSLMRFASPEGFLPNTSWLSCTPCASGVPSLITIRDSRFRTIFTPSIFTFVSSGLFHGFSRKT